MPKLRPKMTVKDLIAFIIVNKLPDDATISLEGCDCVGDCYGFVFWKSANVLEMERGVMDHQDD